MVEGVTGTGTEGAVEVRETGPGVDSGPFEGGDCEQERNHGRAGISLGWGWAAEGVVTDQGVKQLRRGPHCPTVKLQQILYRMIASGSAFVFCSCLPCTLCCLSTRIMFWTSSPIPAVGSGKQ